jgi:hypothetical protein
MCCIQKHIEPHGSSVYEQGMLPVFSVDKLIAGIASPAGCSDYIHPRIFPEYFSRILYLACILRLFHLYGPFFGMTY